jgi:hypothetical protein
MPIKLTQKKNEHGDCIKEKDDNFCADCKEREKRIFPREQPQKEAPKAILFSL